MSVFPELRTALDALTNRIPRTCVRDDGTTDRIWDECLLDQLANAVVQGSESGSGSSGKPKSKPPIPMNVLSLNVEMRTYVTRYANAHLLDMRQLTIAKQLAMVVDHICVNVMRRPAATWAALLTRWADQMRDVSGHRLVRVRELPFNCPVCARRWIPVARDGEESRRPIMSGVFEGESMTSLTCAMCGTWERGSSLDDLVEYMMSLSPGLCQTAMS